jgi:hypothetical protein
MAKKTDAKHAHLLPTEDEKTVRVICDHCQTLLTIPLPQDVGHFSRMLKGFSTTHRTCTPEMNKELVAASGEKGD